MFTLSRSVRFTLPLGPWRDDAPRHNSYAGWPSATEPGITGTMTVTCRGTPDPQTGYLVNITVIDQIVRENVLPLFAKGLQASPPRRLAALLADAVNRISSDLELRPVPARLASVTWHLTPTYSCTLSPDDMNHALLQQSFSFAASHRLHCPEFDDETNRKLFGKCNNPNGHGHNYRLEVVARVPIGDGAANQFGLAELERIVEEQIVGRFDHRHLNLDTEEFRTLNPSVEHIARVCYELLEAPVRDAGAAMARVTLWETEKTACTYPG